jgi:hypothetical protein
MRFRKSFCVGFCVCGSRTRTARAPYKMSPMDDIAVQRKGVRKCFRNKPSGEKLAHDLYFKLLSSEFHDSVIIQ